MSSHHHWDILRNPTFDKINSMSVGMSYDTSNLLWFLEFVTTDYAFGLGMYVCLYLSQY